MFEVVLLLLLACAAGERTVGVCWTRNEVPATAPLDADLWREVRASAVTLRAFHPTLATCLFTNAPRSAVDGAMDALGRRFGASEVGGPAPRSLFTRVVAQPDPAVALAGYPGFRRIAAMNASLASGGAARSADFWTKIKSRVMCIYNVRAAPFDVTLFVDGDTVFCPSADLGARLLLFGGGAPDVRFVPQSASKGTRADAVVEARRLAATARCADVAGDYAACWDGSPAFRAAAARGGAGAAPPGERPCPSLALKGSSRRQRLQSGAILARRGAPLDAFVDAWLAKYLDAYGAAAEGAVADADGSLGSDQPPLRSVVRVRCLRPSDASWVPGALPAAGWPHELAGVAAVGLYPTTTAQHRSATLYQISLSYSGAVF